MTHIKNESKIHSEMKTTLAFLGEKYSYNCVKWIFNILLLLLTISCDNWEDESHFSVDTKDISNITSTTALTGGTFNGDVGSAIMSRGVVWSTNPSPTISANAQTATWGDLDSFDCRLIGLSYSTTYYVRAYATTAEGTTYGDEVSFTTADNVVSALPSFLKLDPFYKKYLNASGIPIVSSEKVPDEAFYNVQKTIDKMDSYRRDVLDMMISKGARMVIMASTEVTTDLPEHKDLTPKVFWDQIRGVGPTIAKPLTTCGEENVLCYGAGSDAYFDEDNVVHEFAHTMHVLGIAFVNRNIDSALEQSYDEAMKNGLWSETYAATNHWEYFAEGVQSWFNVNGEAIPANFIHNEINTREELRTYDPRLYSIIKSYFPDDDEIFSCHQ